MATASTAQTAKMPKSRFQSGAPYGDLVSLDGFHLETASDGKTVGAPNIADGTAMTLEAGDKVRIGILPSGLKLIDVIVQISNAFKSTTTFDLGFEYVDGVDSTAVPQDADYFIVAGSGAAGVVRKNNGATKPVVLPKDAYLIWTNKTVDQDEAGIADVTVIAQKYGVAS